MFDKFLKSENWKGKKEKREEYRGAKSGDATCRNHGSCKYCENNRTFSGKKTVVVAKDEVKGFFMY